MKLGQRTLLALTCWGCGVLLPGSRFSRHARKLSDRRAYIDRRCANCRWGAKLKEGGNGYSG